MGRIFNEGWKFLRFQVIVHKFRDAFGRVTIAGYDRAARVTLFMNFRKNVETASSRIWVGIKVLVGIVINQFFVVHASGVFFYSFSYLVCKIFRLFLVRSVVV